MKSTKLITLFAVCVVCLAIALSTLVLLDKTTDKFPVQSGAIPVAGPASFDIVANKTSLQSLAQSFAQSGLSLYQPSNLPYQLQLTATYASIQNTSALGLAMFTYSAKGLNLTTTAELVIQVAPLGDQSFTNVNGGTPSTINGWPAFVNGRTYIGWPEYQALYGSFAASIDLRIGNMMYSFRAAPPITLSDLTTIVQNMRPTT